MSGVKSASAPFWVIAVAVI